MTELWRDIAGYEGFYQVSDLGMVRRLRRMPSATENLTRLRRPKGNLKRNVNSAGRLQVTLSKLGKKQQLLVHRLVLTAFLGVDTNNPDGLFVAADCSDCRLINLKWGSQSGFITKLDADRVRDIRASTQTASQLANAYGVSSVSISHIRNGKTWREA